MDPAERLRKLYERLPVQSAFRQAIEQALDLAEGLTGISLRPASQSPLADELGDDDEPEPLAREASSLKP